MRKIIHIDMDAFFASVEQRDNPELVGKPLAVGGDPSKRGVVATASYTARQFGIRSAMPMATAVRLCPHLVIIPPRLARYRQIAETIRGIFARFTAKIEPLSIDEAYLEVSSGSSDKHFQGAFQGVFQGSATLLAEHIIDTIQAETRLTASAGVSYCKFLAKYASNIRKPNGVFTITPAQAPAIIAEMPVQAFHGIGPATQKKLNAIGIYNGLDLRRADVTVLREKLGKNADFYYRLAHGKDDRELRLSRERKSQGTETTFSTDLTEVAVMQSALAQLVAEAWQGLTNKQVLPATLTIKIKYADFSLQTKSFTQKTPIDSGKTAQLIAESLLLQAAPKQAVRLLGVSFSHLLERGSYPLQQRLFE